MRTRPPREGLLHHTDRGSPYASEDFRNLLAEIKATPSMSRKGDCWDDPVTESIFSTLVFKGLEERASSTHAAVRTALAEYVDGFQELRRRHSTLGYLSPIEHELRKVVA